MSRHRSRAKIPLAEQLELRILPTVNVAFNPNNGLLKITGDNADNRVEVEGLGDQGEVRVFVDGVFINDFDNVISVKANLKGGDDLLSLSALQIEENVTANLGDGADELDVDATASTITEFVAIGGFLKVVFGNDTGDIAEFDDIIAVGGNVTISGVSDVDFNGDGADFNIELAYDITFFANLKIELSGLGDVDGDGNELDFDNTNVGLTTTLEGSNNVERFEFTSCNFFQAFNANMDDGNDTIDINNGAASKNLFGAQANFRGGDDNDTLLKGLDNVFLQPEFITGFETVV